MRTVPSVIQPETILSESSTSRTTPTRSSHKSVDDIQAQICDTNALNPPVIQKSRLEAVRPRHGAVDGEVVRYLGALAKKDLEGFVYPSVAHIAKKIGRSGYYLALRIQYLEGIGRLIPARRVRNNRELDGWIVRRYVEWKKSLSCGSDAAASAAPNNLGASPNTLATQPNNLGPDSANRNRNSMKPQAHKRNRPTPSSCLERRFTGDDCQGSQSQSTATATATAGISNNRKSFKTRKQKLEDRLIERIRNDGDTLRQYLQEYPESTSEHSESLVKLFRAACKFLAYAPDEDSPDLACDFCGTLGATWEKHQGRLQDGNMEPSTLCSKAIDSCEESYTVWPPSFSEHRNLLREAEKSGRLQFFVSDSPNGNRIRLRVYPKSLSTGKTVRR